MRSLVVAVALLVTACAPKQAQKTMHYAQWTLVGGLVGVLATSLAAAATHDSVKDAMIAADVTSGGVAVGALVVYLIADVNDVDEPSQSAQAAADEEAWSLTKRAQEAARKGDCDRVKKIEPVVKQKDPSFYGTVFMRDVAIQRCLSPQGH